MRSVAVKLSRFAFEGLHGGDGNDAVLAPVGMADAIRYYLADRDVARPAWPYPGFLRGSEAQEDVEIELEIDDELWRSFEAEAGRQDVSVQQLLEHAAFYFTAELNAGRITQRILDDLDSTESRDDPG